MIHDVRVQALDQVLGGCRRPMDRLQIANLEFEPRYQLNVFEIEWNDVPVVAYRQPHLPLTHAGGQ